MLKLISNDEGITLVELVIVMALLTVVLLLGYTLFFFGTGSFDSGTAQANAQQQARIIDEYFRSTLRNASKLSLYGDELSEEDAAVYDGYFTIEDNIFINTGTDLTGNNINEVWVEIKNPEQEQDKLLLEYEIDSEDSTQEYNLTNQVVLNNIEDEDYFIEGDVDFEGSLNDFFLYYAGPEHLLPPYYPEDRVWNEDKDEYYNEIGDAIDDASVGNTIVVCSAEYNGPIEINSNESSLDGLNLRGFPLNEYLDHITTSKGRILDEDGSLEGVFDENDDRPPEVISTGHGIHIENVENVAVINFDVSGAGDRGVYAENADGVLLDSIFADDCDNDGIRVTGSKNATVQNSVSKNNDGDGITFYAYGEISGCRIEGNNERGIYHVGSSAPSDASDDERRVIIKDNIVKGNEWEEDRAGGIVVYGGGSGKNTISAEVVGNTVEDNKGNGIILYKVNYDESNEPWKEGMRRSMIKNNSVSGTTANDHDDRGEGDGIVVYLSHNVDIEENEVDYNDQAGIRITSDKPYGVQEDTTDITVDNNEVENNQYGVLVQDGVKGLSIIENTIDQNEKGVYVEHSNDEDRGAEVAEITGNIISNNDQEGVLVEEWAKVYAIEDNELEGNGSSDPGIDIHTIYPGNVNITGNIIGDSHNFGLYIRNIDDDAGAIKLSIEGNELKDNETGMGFDSIKLSDGGSSLEVKENNYFDNNEDGLHFSENCVFEGIIDRIVIIRNRFEGNNRFGLNNLSGDEIDATENWWGADDGPSGEGGGDAVSEDVLFDPWYMDKEMESLSSD